MYLRPSRRDCHPQRQRRGVAAQTQMSPVSRLHWSRLSGGSSRPIAGSSSSPNSRAALQSRRTRPAPLLRELSKNSEVEPMDPVRLGAHFLSPCNLESSRPAGDLVAAAMDLPSSSLGLQIRLRHYRMLGSLHSWRGRQSAHWPIGGSRPGGAGVRWPRHFLRCEQRRSPFTMDKSAAAPRIFRIFGAIKKDTRIFGVSTFDASPQATRGKLAVTASRPTLSTYPF